MRIGMQAVSATLGATALEIYDLLHPGIELSLPSTFGNISIIVAVKKLFDGGCAVGENVSACWRPQGRGR